MAEQLHQGVDADVLPALSQFTGYVPPFMGYDRVDFRNSGWVDLEVRIRTAPGRQDLAGNAKSYLLNTAGSLKVITAENGQVRGVHKVGDRVGELIGEAQILCSLGISAADAASFLEPHPSHSEALGEALMAVAGKSLHGH